MAMFLVRRLGLMLLTLWILSVIVFLAGQVLPGDPGRAILGNFASASAVKALDDQLGVGQPLLNRYLDWIGGLLHGNMGTSYSYRTAVATLVGGALLNSLKITLHVRLTGPGSGMDWEPGTMAPPDPDSVKDRKSVV